MKTRYQAALRYLYGFIDFERDPGTSTAKMDLANIEALLRRLDHPERKWPSVHVAGTKGKGSTAAMIASILQHSGYRTGLYTSPHLVSMRERMRIDGEAISKESICRLVETLRPVVEATLKASSRALTFFDVWTALAFLYFAERRVDVAVVEVGLGGRLDSTNVLKPAVAVITPVGLDHTDRLGTTLAAIAGEKAGIIKQGVPAICASQEPDAMAVIRDTCRVRGSALCEIDRDVTCRILEADTHGQRFDVEGRDGRYSGLEMPLLGAYQASNAATAIGAVEALRRRGFSVTPQGVAEGFRTVRSPGRLQVVRRRPWMLLDGAHNMLAARVLVRNVRWIFPYRRAILILSLHADKDVRGICRTFATLADEVIVTRRRVMRRRQADADAVAALFRDGRTPVSVTPTVSSALALADTMATPDDLICVTGSFALVGETIEVLHGLEAEEALSR